FVSFTSPLSGTLDQDASGGWRYTPSPGFTGSDRFTYTVADATGHTATAEVVVLVTSFTSVSGDASAATPAAAPTSASTEPSGAQGGGVASSATGGRLLEALAGALAQPATDVAQA